VLLSTPLHASSNFTPFAECICTACIKKNSGLKCTLCLHYCMLSQKLITAVGSPPPTHTHTAVAWRHIREKADQQLLWYKVNALHLHWCPLWWHVNPLQHSGNHMYHMFHVQNTLQFTHTMYLCVFYVSHSIQQSPYILESNPHLVFATFLNGKKLVHRPYHFSKIQL
jgi:hypothetical protein